MYEKKYKINKETKVFMLSSKISKMSNNGKFTLKSMLLNPQINRLSSNSPICDGRAQFVGFT